MSGVPPPEQLWRRSVLASMAVHVVLILVPAAVLQSLGGGTPDLPRSRDGGFVVSLYPVSREPAAPPAEVGPPAPPEPVSEPQPAPDEEVLPEVQPEADPVAGQEAAPAPAATSRQKNPPGSSAGSAIPGGDPGPGEPGEPARYQPPRLLAGALPIDPEDSGALDVPEEIPVRLRVGKTGKVIEIVPADPRLSAPVLAAIKRSAEAMRFSPARVGKKPVEAWFTMTFVYRR